jgi:5'-3' exonuclease
MFLTKLYSEYNTNREIDLYRFAEDYKFLSFMFGNDFVKPVPYLKIKEDNTRTLIEAYITVQNDPETLDKYLVKVVPGEEPVLNLEFLGKLIKIMASVEKGLLQNMQRSRDRIRKFVPQAQIDPEDKDSLYEKALNDMEHAMFYDKRNPFFFKYNYLFSKIDYYSEDYLSQYNNFFFGNDNIQDVMNQYIRSLKYTLNYYNGYVDQRYYYPYRAAPLLSNFLQRPGMFMNLDLTFDYKTKPVSQYEQLLIILPPKMRTLLPKNITSGIPYSLNKLYRNTEKGNVMLDVVQGQKYIYTPLILYDLPIEEVIVYMKTIPTKYTSVPRNSVGTIVESSSSSISSSSISSSS